MSKAQRTVLIVDDAKEDRMMIRRALRQDPTIDYHFLEAENGAQALACLHQQQPDCLLLDYHLPDTTGLQLLQRVVASVAPHIYPIVMLTGASSATVAVQALQQGAHDFLSKHTFAAEQLQRVVNNATEKVVLLRQLEAQREWSRLTLASIGDGVITTDTRGCITFMNPVAEALTGWTSHTAYERPLALVFAVQDQAGGRPLADPAGLVLQTRQPVSQTNAMLLAQAAQRMAPIDYSAAPILDRRDNVSGVVLTFRDISARQAAEEALRASEQFSRTLLESSPDCVKVLDVEGRLLRMNGPGLCLMEIDDFEPLVGQAWESLWPRDYSDLIRMSLAAARDGKQGRFAGFCPTVKGTPKWWDVIVAPVQDRQGTTTHFIAASRDMTEAKAAEAALRTSEAQLAVELADAQQLQQISTQLIEEENITLLYQKLLDAAIALMHAAMGSIQMLDSEKNELHLLASQGFAPAAVAHWQQVRADAASTCSRALHTGKRVIAVDIESCDFMAETADLAFYRLCGIRSVQSTPLVARSGRIVGMISTHWPEPYQPSERELRLLDVLARQAADLLERKQAQEALRASEAKLKVILDNTPAAIYMLAPDHRYLFVNRCFAEGYNQTEADIVGLSAFDRFSPEVAAALAENERRVLASRTPMIFEEAAPRLGQMEYYTTVKAPVLDEAGEPYAIIGISLNITERKRAEEEVQRSRHLLQRVAEASPDNINVYDLRHQRMIYSNRQPGMSDFSGKTVWETTPAEIDSHIHPDDVARVQAEFQRIHTAGDGEVVETLFRWRFPTGEYRWLQDRTVVFARDEQGQVTQHLSIATDITERKQAELNRQFLFDLGAALNQMTDPTRISQTVVERLGHYLGASRCVFNAIDLPGDQATMLAGWGAPGEPPATAVKPLSAQASPAYIAQAQAGRTLVVQDAHHDERTEVARALLLKTGAPATIRVPCLRNGEWVASLHVLQNSPRQWRPDEVQLVESVVQHFWPLVEKARAEQELRRQEEFVRQIADNVPGLIGYLGADERYHFANTTFAQWFQRPRHTIIDCSVRDMIGAAEHDRLGSYRYRALAGETITYEETFAYPDGVTRSVWGRYQPDIAADGTVRGFYIFVMDITEQKQAAADRELLADVAEAIRQAASAEALMAATVQLVGEHLAVGRALCYEIDHHNQQRLVRSQYSPLLPPLAHAAPLAGFSAAIQAELQAGRTVVVTDTQGDPRTQTRYETVYAPRQAGAFISVPCLYEDAWHAQLTVMTATPRAWQPREIGLLESVVERVWLAVQKLRLDAELRQNEERLRQALAAAHAGGWSYDLVTDTAHWSPEMFALYGLPSTTAAPSLTAFAALIHPADRQQASAEMQAAASRGGSFAVEFRVVRADGAEGWIRSSGVVELDEMGRPLAARGIDQDISERKAAELALQQSNAILSGVLESSADAIFVRDLTGRYLLVNNSAAEQVRIPREAMIGQRYDELFPADADAIHANDRPVIEEGQSITIEHITQHDGVTRHWHTLKTPLRNDQGKIIGLISSARDLTERKQMEERLRASEERFRQTFAQAPVGVGQANLAGQIEMVNPAFCRLLGYTEAELIGRNLREITIPDDRPAEVAAIAQAQRRQQPASTVEKRYRRKDGSLVWVNRVGSIVRDNKGQPLFGIAILEDITTRKQQEEELRQLNLHLEQRVEERTRQLEQKNVELERSNKELEKFAYVASHDLRSPLRAIDNLSSWIAEDAADVLPDASKEHLNKMRGRVRRMDKLLDDLLAFSRIGRFAYNAEPINLKALLENLIGLLNPPPTFRVIMAETMPNVRAQRVPLELVLRNLVGNAIKHHDRPDGSVQITVQEEGDWLHFVVSDDGPGIDPKFHGKIFEIFQTLKPRDQMEGSGMGLAIVKKAVELVGGAITVESSVGAGATFRFTWLKAPPL